MTSPGARVAALLATAVATFAVTEPARAESGAKTHWVPNRPLAYAGGTVFLAGYVPAVAAGLPATGTVVLDVFTLLLAYEVAGCPGRGEADKGYVPNSRDYWCLDANGGAQLLVPVAGPLLFAHDHPHDAALNRDGNALSRGAQGVLVADAVAQGAGIGLLAAAAILGQEEPRVDDPPTRGGRRFFVSPVALGRGFGVAAAVTSW
jgi:hypothetical protein